MRPRERLARRAGERANMSPNEDMRNDAWLRSCIDTEIHRDECTVTEISARVGWRRTR